MLIKLKKTIEENDLLIKGASVLVALSGGADSVALLKGLIMLSEDYRIQLAAVHFNHRWRGEESDRDRFFVQNFCKSLGIRLLSGESNLPALANKQKFSETLAREERFTFLKEAAIEAGAQRIALGHNYHDQVETVLLNLLRGTGISGLKGMLPLREGTFIRPLLQIKREEIYSFLRQEGLDYLEDSSNRDEAYLRNRIRRHLIPLLKEQYDPHLERHIHQLAEIARQEDDYISRQTRAFLDNQLDEKGGSLRLDSLLAQHEAIIRRVIKTLLDDILPPGKEAGYVHVQAVEEFVRRRKPRSGLNICRDWQLRIENEYLIMEKCPGAYRTGHVREPGFSYEVRIPGQIKIVEIGMIWDFKLIDKFTHREHYAAQNEILIDYEKIAPPLLLRTRRPGDRIQPKGMKGRKTIKKLFIDQKIPGHQRGLIPLLVDRDAVIAVAPGRISERVCISSSTRLIIRIEII